MEQKPRRIDEHLKSLSRDDVKRLIGEACFNQLGKNRKEDLSDTSPESAVMFAMFWNDPEEAFKYLLENAKD